MANQDRAIWLDKFYGPWLYKPYEIHPNQTSSLQIALSSLINININETICLLLPEGRCKSFKKPAIIFPRYLRLSPPKGIWEIQKPIYFKGRYQSMDEFIATCPKLDPSSKKPFYAPMFPLSLFLMPSKELTDFKRNYIQKVRDALLELEVIKSNQGKYDHKSVKEKDRDEYMIQLYKELGRPIRLPMKEILEKCRHYLNGKYLEVVAHKLEPTERMVRYVLKPYMKKISR